MYFFLVSLSDATVNLKFDHGYENGRENVDLKGGYNRAKAEIF